MAEENARFWVGCRVVISQEAWAGQTGTIIKIEPHDEESRYSVRMDEPYRRTVYFYDGELSLCKAKLEFAQLDCTNYGPVDVDSWMDRHDVIPENALKVLQEATNDYLLSLKALQVRIQEKYGPKIDKAMLNPSEPSEDILDIDYPPGTDDLWYD